MLEVTPDLKAFSETAKVKWKPDPEAADVQQLANALGGLADYISFFESKDTRITEYYVDLVKIHDARAVIMLRKAQAEAKEKLEKEKAELETKRASASPEEIKKLEEELKRNELALQKIEEMVKLREDTRKKQGQYALSDEEIARVEARLEEIDRVFVDAGYIKKNEANLGAAKGDG